MLEAMVSIPKRVSEVLKRLQNNAQSSVIKVSIPKRVSEVLKLVSQSRQSSGAVVSIPKRVSEVLKQKRAIACLYSWERSFNP